MHVNYRALAEQIGKGVFRVVGNLPYNISTPILFRLLEFSDVIKDMHFMLQKKWLIASQLSLIQKNMADYR